MLQTLQVQEIQTGLGQKDDACNLQIHRWVRTLGDKELCNGWLKIGHIGKFKAKEKNFFFFFQIIDIFLKFRYIDIPMFRLKLKS